MHLAPPPPGISLEKEDQNWSGSFRVILICFKIDPKINVTPDDIYNALCCVGLINKVSHSNRTKFQCDGDRF